MSSTGQGGILKHNDAHKERIDSYPVAIKAIDLKYQHARVLHTGPHYVFLKEKKTRTQTLSFPLSNEFHS